MKTSLFHYLSVFLLPFIYTTVSAAPSVVYSVVGLPSSNKSEFGVLIDDIDVYRLTPSKEDPTILFQIEAPIAQTKYSFVEVSKISDNVTLKEGFERDPITSQINHVYGRSWTTRSVKTFERVYDEVGARQETDLHPADELPSLHIVAAQNEIDHIHEHYNQKIKIEVDLIFIGAHDIQKFSGAKFNIGGRSTRFEKKPSYNIKLDKNDDLGGYRSLKLKATTMDDPSFLRNKLSFDMRAAAGLPGTRMSYKRVYLNNVALGLFTFYESYDETWFSQNANPGIVSDYKNGVLYEGVGRMINRTGEYTDLTYISDAPEVYGQNGYKMLLEDKSEERGFTPLAKFIKFIDVQLKAPVSNNTDDEKEIATEWGKYINVEAFLRNIVFEFLTTSWDSYLCNGNNYLLYEWPVLHSFVFLDWDMDFSFGNDVYLLPLRLEGDYRHFDGIQDRPLTKALLRIPLFRTYFETAIEKILHSIFDPRVSFPVIDSLVDLVKEDVMWDRTIPRINANTDFKNKPVGNPEEGEIVPAINSTLPLSKNSQRPLLDEIFNPDRQMLDYQLLIDGPTPFGSLMGVKEFIQSKYDNVGKHI